MKNTIFFLANDRAHATEMIAALKKAGIEENCISIVLNETSQSNEVADDPALPHYHNKSVLVTALASIAGIGAGATLGWMALGPFLAIGPLVAAIGGGTVGGATGGLLGAMASAGVPEMSASESHEKILRGSVLVAVHPVDKEARTRVEDFLKSHNLRQLNSKQAQVIA